MGGLPAVPNAFYFQCYPGISFVTSHLVGTCYVLNAALVIVGDKNPRTYKTVVHTPTIWGEDCMSRENWTTKTEAIRSPWEIICRVQFA